MQESLYILNKVYANSSVFATASTLSYKYVKGERVTFISYTLITYISNFEAALIGKFVCAQCCVLSHGDRASSDRYVHDIEKILKACIYFRMLAAHVITSYHHSPATN